MTDKSDFHLLLVEDDLGDAEAFEATLRKESPNSTFTCVGSGEEALAYLLRRGAYHDAPTPDLVLLDWALPGLSGLEVLQAIKRERTLVGMPVIVYSGTKSAEDIRLAYANHASAFIEKPANLDRMIQTHRALRDFWRDIASLPHLD